MRARARARGRTESTDVEEKVGTGQTNYRPPGKSGNGPFIPVCSENEKVCARVALNSALDYHLQARILHLFLTAFVLANGCNNCNQTSFRNIASRIVIFPITCYNGFPYQCILIISELSASVPARVRSAKLNCAISIQSQFSLDESSLYRSIIVHFSQESVSDPSNVTITISEYPFNFSRERRLLRAKVKSQRGSKKKKTNKRGKKVKISCPRNGIRLSSYLVPSGGPVRRFNYRDAYPATSRSDERYCGSTKSAGARESFYREP